MNGAAAARSGFLVEGVRNLVAILVIWGNVVVIAHAAGVPIPAPRWLVVPFNMHGVFIVHETVNRDVLIEVERDGEWVVLDTDEYFPYLVWRRTQRLGVRGYIAHEAMTVPEARRFLAGRIRARYNRAHPDRPATGIRIWLLTWPRRVEGYYARREEDVRRELLYEE